MPYYLGIDLGGTNIVAGVVDAEYKLVHKISEPTVLSRPFEEIMASMAALAQKAMAAFGLENKDLPYIGLGVPSSINPQNKRVVFANNLGWKDKDAVGEFQKHLNIPVELANDADCAALGEALAGAAQNYKSALVITLGTGVGSGMVIDGKLFLGGDGFGIELGHGTLVEDGMPCTCGRSGCLEAYASVTALIRQTMNMMSIFPHSQMWEECGQDLNRVSGRTAFNAAKKGDLPAQRVVDEYIAHVGTGLASLVALFRPHAILIGGGVSNEGEYLLAPLRKIVAETMYAHEVLQPPAVLKAQLGNDAGIIGAALLGLGLIS